MLIYGVVGVVITFGARALWNEDTKMLIAPFLIVSMLMFIRMGFTLVDNSTKDYALQLHLIIFSIIVMVAVGLYWINKEAVLSIKTGPYYLIVLLLCIEFIYMVFFMGIVIRRLRKVGRHTQNIIRQFILLILAGLLLRGVSLAFHAVANWALPLLILIYFLSPFMAMWYLRQHSDIVFEPLSAERPSSIKKIQFNYQENNGIYLPGTRGHRTAFPGQNQSTNS